jgi:hypothetical protein
MAFGQSAGPPASHRQVQELLELLQNAGHTDCDISRAPPPASAHPPPRRPPPPRGGGAPPAPVRAKPERLSATERTLRGLPAEALAAELQRRGWAVMEP